MDTAGLTRVKTGQGGALVPALAEEAQMVEAHQRSPTLMAGDVAGSQGSVRVWAPNRRILWTSCIGFLLGSILMTAITFVAHNAGAFSYTLMMLWCGFFITARALWRPCYLTTDDAGIGITTNKGSQALRWSEICTAAKIVNTGAYDYPRIKLRAPEPVEINLTGYPQSQRAELLALISARADLQPFPGRSALYVHPQRPLPEAQGLMDGPDADIRSLVMEGRIKEAAQLYQKRHGVKRKDAVEIIDALDMELVMLKPAEVVQARFPDAALRNEIQSLLQAGQRRRALGAYRKQSHLGRQTATDTIGLLETASLRALPPGEER